MAEGGFEWKAFDAARLRAHPSSDSVMSWQTAIARRVFPKDQKFLAKRKLRIALWVLAVSLIASSIVLWVLMVIGAQQH